MMRAATTATLLLALAACNEPVDESTVYPELEFVEIADPSQRTPDPLQPRLASVYDAASDGLYVLGYSEGNNRRLELNQCDAEGDGCTFRLLTTDPVTGLFPSAVIDQSARALIVATTDGWRRDNPLLVRCDLDGTACDEHPLIPGPADPQTATGVYPSVGLDVARDRIVIATNDFSTFDSQLAVWTTDRNGQNATFHPITAVPPRPEALQPTLIVDSARDAYLIVIYDGLNQGGFSIVTCPADFTDCTVDMLLASRGIGYTPRAVMDDRGRLYVTTYTEAGDIPAYLWRCEKGGTWDCYYEELTKDLPTGSGYTPVPLVDEANDEIVVVMTRASKSLRAFVRYCDMDKTQCGFGPEPGGSVPIDSAYYPAPLFARSGEQRRLVIAASVYDPLTELYRPGLQTSLYPELFQRD